MPRSGSVPASELQEAAQSSEDQREDLLTCSARSRAGICSRKERRSRILFATLKPTGFRGEVMKKYIRTALAFGMLVLFLAAGCSSGQPAAGSSASGSSQGEASTEQSSASSAAAAPETSNLDPNAPVTITLWHYYTGENQQELDNAIAEFNQTVGRERGVVVEGVAMGNLGELEDAVTDSAKGVISSEEMPNVFSCYADKALELDELGALCDMSTYFTKEEQDQYVEGFINDGIFDGKLEVLPIVKSTELLYVNDTALQEYAAANPGTEPAQMLSTWESLYELSKGYYEWTDAQTPDTPWDGRGFMGIDELANFLIISNKQLGVDILDGDTSSVHLDTGVLRKIFDVYFQAMSLGYFDQVGRFCSDDVRTGDLAAYVGSSSSASYFPSSVEKNGAQEDIDLLASPYPVFESGAFRAVQQGAGMAVAKADPAAEEGACMFLKWFTDIPQNVPFAMKTGYLPVKSAAYESEEFDTALAELTSGATDAQNVGEVYTIALEAIVDDGTYAAKPFNGSYDVRSMFKDTLSAAAAAGREAAAPLKAEGQTEEQILAALDTGAQFESWLASVRAELDLMGVQYSES